MRYHLCLVVLLAGACSSSPSITPDQRPPSDGPRLEGPGLDASLAGEGQRDRSLSLDAPACATPRPFVPPGQPTAWKQLATKLLVVTQGPANHRAQDAIVLAGAPQLLIGKFAYGAFDKDLKGEDVEIFIQQSPPCGDWISLGTGVTSEDGQHGTQYGIEDDGGRIFFTIPAAQARAVGRHPVRMLVKGDHSQAAMILHVVNSGTSTVVFDIDGTLTTDDFQLVAQLFGDLLSGKYTPNMHAGATDFVKAWAGKGYLVLYLTGRPDQLEQITRSWLVGKAFPAGALRLTNTAAEALPTSTGVAAFKGKLLTSLGSQAKLSFHAAFGNATTDIEAYAAAGIDKARTYIIGPNAGKDGTVAVESYVKLLPTAQAAPPAAVPAPTPVGW